MTVPKKAAGGLMLILGIIGLLLLLILWLPTRINLTVMVLISVVCLVSVWGGGRLSEPKTGVYKAPEGRHEPVVQPPPKIQQEAACFRCGSPVVLGQRFCGTCGSSLMAECPRCGAATPPAFRFCGNCGAKLG